MVTPLRQLMNLARHLQGGLGGSPSAAGTATTLTGDLRVGECLGVQQTIAGTKEEKKRVARRKLGDQWKATQIVAITSQEVTLRELESNSSYKRPLAVIVQDLGSGSPKMFKRISGPEELAEDGVYVEKGTLKKEFRGQKAIRNTFYPGEYAASAATFRDNAKAAAKTSPLYAASNLGPDTWLCPGFQRSPHLVVDKGEVDHRVPVAQHWSEIGGNNTDQDARQAFNLDTGNLQLLCEDCNGAKSSKTMDGKATTYVNTVGALFTGPDGKR